MKEIIEGYKDYFSVPNLTIMAGVTVGLMSDDAIGGAINNFIKNTLGIADDTQARIVGVVLTFAVGGLIYQIPNFFDFGPEINTLIKVVGIALPAFTIADWIGTKIGE